MTVINNNIIVYCYGDEKNDIVSGHPLIYLYKEGSKTLCPYCNKLMNKELKKNKSNDRSKSKNIP